MIRYDTKGNIYTISTQEVERWLQELIDTGAITERRCGVYPPKVNVALTTLPLSSKFYPFKMVLSEGSWVPGNERVMYNHVFVILRDYMYGDRDIEDFNREDVIRNLDLDSDTRSYAIESAKLDIDNTHGAKIIQCLVDPLRIFHALAITLNEDLRQFLVNILKVEKNQEDYLYTFETVPTERNGKWLIGETNPILDDDDVDGHTKYLQGIDLPIKVNSIIEDGELKLSDVSEMHIADVDGVSTLIITPEIVG